MINHVRTLLRNAQPEPYAGLVGQEFVDPAFRPVALPAPLATARVALFGRRPDRTALDLKLRRYMALLHATGLADAVTAADPRVTYPAPVVDRLEFDFAPRVEPSGGHAHPLYVTGDPPGEDGGGALDYAWLVVAGPEAVVDLLRPTSRRAVVPAAYDRGLSAPIPLPGGGLACRFHADVPPGTAWTVACTARPAADLGDVLALLEGAGDAVTALFGAPPAGPYRTWRALWDSAAPLPYRLGAILLALAARTDELRRH